MYSPKARPAYVCGEAHGRKSASPSGAMNAHSKVTPGWSDEKVKVASVLSVAAAGAESMNVSGVGVTVQA